MRLSQIDELATTPRRSGRPISDIASAFVSLLNIVKTVGGQMPQIQTALDSFMREPSAQNWEETRWVIEAIARLLAGNQQGAELLREIEILGTSPGQLVSAAMYDLPAQEVSGTPLARLELPRVDQKRVKSALGPTGYVGLMPNLHTLPTTSARRMLQLTAQNAKAARKATQLNLRSRDRKEF